MTIKIIQEPDIYITQEEYNRLQQDYQKSCMFMVNPPSFEQYVKQHRKLKEQLS